jgi:hypothetical protein
MKKWESYDAYAKEFACWTSARAVQRGFTTSKIIKTAIVASGLDISWKTLNKSDVTSEEYGIWHHNTAEAIIAAFKTQKMKCSFGRAAKMIAIYLKTIHIMGNPQSQLSKVAFPPIDRILLKTLKSDLKELKIKPVNWTELQQKGYVKLLIAIMKIAEAKELKYLWQIEKDWKMDNS